MGAISPGTVLTGCPVWAVMPRVSQGSASTTVDAALTSNEAVQCCVAVPWLQLKFFFCSQTFCSPMFSLERNDYTRKTLVQTGQSPPISRLLSCAHAIAVVHLQVPNQQHAQSGQSRPISFVHLIEYGASSFFWNILSFASWFSCESSWWRINDHDLTCICGWLASFIRTSLSSQNGHKLDPPIWDQPGVLC